jgi:acyl-CoA synthetase (AMP-forming)/AMP-acid ligase II
LRRFFIIKIKITRRLAASLRQRFGLEAGERVAIVAKNSPDYLELMFGIWHAGLAAVPANAKLHGPGPTAKRFAVLLRCKRSLLAPCVVDPRCSDTSAVGAQADIARTS